MQQIRPGLSRFSLTCITGMALVVMVTVLIASATASASSALNIDPALKEQIEAVGEGAQVKAILTFSERPSADIVDSVGSRLEIVQRFEHLPMLVVYGFPAQIGSLYDLPGLISVEADRQLEYYTREGVAIAGGNSRQRGSLSSLGRGVGVAILDSGIDGSHPDVRYPDRTVQNVKIECVDTSCNSYMYVENVQNTDTSSGHGTHVAGIAAGDGSAQSGWYAGMAPRANLVGISAGDTIYITTALAGFDYILDHKGAYNIRVVNCSWGTTGSYKPGDAINVATRNLHDNGITVVFAAGNSGPGNDTLNPYSVAPWVIGVAGAAKDGRTLADFSSRGIPGDPVYHPTLTAPGVSIVSTKSSTPVVTGTSLNDARSKYYTALSGTSMAAPFVTGTIAAMIEAKPGLTPDAIKSILVDSAVPMSGGAYQVGAGFLSASNAVALAATGNENIGTDSSFVVTGTSGTSSQTSQTPTIILTFSHALNAASVNSGNIFLLDKSSGSAVGVNVTSSAAKQVTVAPQKKLATNKDYVVVVSDGIRNTAGNYPMGSYALSFHTKACPAAVCLNLPL